MLDLFPVEAEGQNSARAGVAGVRQTSAELPNMAVPHLIPAHEFNRFPKTSLSDAPRVLSLQASIENGDLMSRVPLFSLLHCQKCKHLVSFPGRRCSWSTNN